MADKRRTSGGGWWNGFETIPEEPALQCSEKYIAPYTLPQEALIFVPTPEDAVCIFKNGDKERKIHNNIELDEDEKKALEMLQQEAKRQGQKFLPSITAMATRFLSRARGDPVKAVALMLATQAWRLEYFGAGPVRDDQVMEDLKHGIVYFTGRDSSLRPTIIVRPRRIPQEWYRLKCIDRMIKVLIFAMEYMLWYMMIPGRIENTNVIVDLKTLGITQLPLGALNDIYKVMSHHYIGRVFRFYVVNLSWMLNTISGAVKAILTDRQKQKLMILDDVKELRESFALHQLEEDLGGTRPATTEFFPFDMPPGPFTAGSSSGPVQNASSGLHNLLSDGKAARQGQLWDSSKSLQENTKLRYSEEAYTLFERCNYPIPPACPVPRQISSEKPPEKQLSGQSEPSLQQVGGRRVSQRVMRQSLKDLGIVSCDLNLPAGAEPEFSDEEQGEQGEHVPPASGFKTSADRVQPLQVEAADKKNGLFAAGQNADEAEFVSADMKSIGDEGQQVSPSGWLWCGVCRGSSHC